MGGANARGDLLEKDLVKLDEKITDVEDQMTSRIEDRERFAKVGHAGERCVRMCERESVCL